MLRHRSQLVVLLLLTFLIIQLFSFVPNASATELKDLASCSAYARQSVERLVNEGIISGDQNGYFNPKSNVTRGQMITIIVRALKIDQDSVPASPTFKDVPINHWANQYVETAFQKGIAAGLSSDEFGIDAQCTREQMAAMFVRSFNILDPEFFSTPLPAVDLNTYSDNQQVSTWAKSSIGFALYSGLLYGTTSSTISPGTMATREQAAVLIDRLLNRKNTIVADRQASDLLKQAGKQFGSSASLANTDEVKVNYSLWNSWSDLPAQFSINVDSTDEIMMPGSVHSKIRMEAEGLPQDQYPPYEDELYLANNIFYENTIDNSTNTGWGQYPPLTAQEVEQILNDIKDQFSQITEPGMEAHQTGVCTIENAVVNGDTGYKVTYTANIPDLSAYLDGSTGLLSQYSGILTDFTPEIIDSFAGASYTQTFYLSSIDGRLYGANVNFHIDCRQPDNTDAAPIKSADLTIVSKDYKYSGVSIAVPDGAKNAPLITN